MNDVDMARLKRVLGSLPIAPNTAGFPDLITALADKTLDRDQIDIRVANFSHNYAFTVVVPILLRGLADMLRSNRELDPEALEVTALVMEQTAMKGDEGGS